MPGAICGMRVCLLVELRPGEETDNVRSAGTIAACPTQRARLTAGGPLGQQRPLHRSPPSASFPPFTCSLVALLWLSIRRKRPNSRLTTRTRTGQRKPYRNIHLLVVYFRYYLLRCLRIWIHSGAKHHCVLLGDKQQFCCEFVWNYYRLQK